MNDETKEILKGVFSNIPQVQAYKMIRESSGPVALKAAIETYLGLQLGQDQMTAIKQIYSLDKLGREKLAGEILGEVIAVQAPGLFSRIMGFLFGWMRIK